jgi:hypothetical protein
MTAQLRKNLFDEKVANALLAFPGPAPATGRQGEAGKKEDANQNLKPIGVAIYFFNFSTWTGRPGLFVSLLNL